MLVEWLRHCPFTAETGVRFSYMLQKKKTMENLLKKVNVEDFVPGKMYADTDVLSKYNLTCVLEFVRKDEDTLYFKKHSGVDWYIKNSDGTVSFTTSCDFYELNDEQIEYLKTNKW